MPTHDDEMPTPGCIGSAAWPELQFPRPVRGARVSVRAVQPARPSQGQFMAVPPATYALLDRMFSNDGYRFDGIVYLDDPNFMPRKRDEIVSEKGCAGLPRSSAERRSEPIRFSAPQAESLRFAAPLSFDMRGSRMRLTVFEQPVPAGAVIVPETFRLTKQPRYGTIRDPDAKGVTYEVPHSEQVERTDTFSFTVEGRDLGRSRETSVGIRLLANRPPRSSRERGPTASGSAYHEIPYARLAFADPDGDDIDWNSLEVRLETPLAGVTATRDPERQTIVVRYGPSRERRTVTLSVTVADMHGMRSEPLLIALAPAPVEQYGPQPLPDLRFETKPGDVLSLRLDQLFQDRGNALSFAPRERQAQNENLDIDIDRERKTALVKARRGRSPSSSTMQLKAVTADGSVVTAEATVTFGLPPAHTPPLRSSYTVGTQTMLRAHALAALLGPEVAAAYDLEHAEAIPDPDAGPVEVRVVDSQIEIRRPVQQRGTVRIKLRLRPHGGGEARETEIVQEFTASRPSVPPAGTPPGGQGRRTEAVEPPNAVAEPPSAGTRDPAGSGPRLTIAWADPDIAIAVSAIQAGGSRRDAIVTRHDARRAATINLSPLRGWTRVTFRRSGRCHRAVPLRVNLDTASRVHTIEPGRSPILRQQGRPRHGSGHYQFEVAITCDGAQPSDVLGGTLMEFQIR